jgi:hypothetical protein
LSIPTRLFIGASVVALGVVVVVVALDVAIEYLIP